MPRLIQPDLQTRFDVEAYTHLNRSSGQRADYEIIDDDDDKDAIADDPQTNTDSRSSVSSNTLYQRGIESWESSFERFPFSDGSIVGSDSSLDIQSSLRSCEDEEPKAKFDDPLKTYPETEEKFINTSGIASQASYPNIPKPHDRARKLTRRLLASQRYGYFAFILLLNMSALIAALLIKDGLWIFVFILMIKAKDFLSALLAAVSLPIRAILRKINPVAEVSPQWILSLIPTYSESEEQIVKTIFSLRDNHVEPHKQLMCVILDGKHRDIKGCMTKITASFTRPYVTFKSKLGELSIDAGFMENVPVLVIEKRENAGKKDSLILGHDLFNCMRGSAPLYTQFLRREIWSKILPGLTGDENFAKFDMIFCTDADSQIHKGAIAALANAIARESKAIAACGLVLVELEPGAEWSVWNLYQQFQYTFGQYVRRRAESIIGKVTCLPGCIQMISVRPEMAGAISKYAEPVTAWPVLRHQVQYLGTDRRLTYSMLSQGTHLITIFVPEAVSETVAPQSLQHYLSQRRRWGSNAYFNNFFYCFGENMILITRITSCLEIVRISMVYYRICNSVLFVYSLTKDFKIVKIIPLLCVSQWPTLWFTICVLFLERPLRERAHKLALGWAINKIVAPAMSVIVFTKIALNIGSQAWGMTGGSAAPVPESSAAQVLDTGLPDETAMDDEFEIVAEDAGQYEYLMNEGLTS